MTAQTAIPAAALPPLLADLQFDMGLLDREPRPVDLLDGHILPRGTATLIATDPGSGKSTSALVSGISSAFDGTWSMFGSRKHVEPLRVVIILGEDNDRSFETVLSGLPDDAKNQIRIASLAGRLVISPFRRWARTQEEPDLFDGEGKLTASGQTFFNAMRQFRPDVIVLDTITSLSACPYLDKSHAYRTMNILNDVADELNAAVLLMMHLTKEGGSNLTDKVTADDLTARLAGSAGWRAAARHVIAMAPCPAGRFENVQLVDDRDTKWVAGIKTNLLPDAAKALFPVIRSRSEMMLKTVDEDGTPLLNSNDQKEKELQKKLREFLEIYVEAAARIRSPFMQKPTGKFSAEKLFTGPLSDMLPERATETQIRRAMEALERMGKIVSCTASRAGGSAVWDVPHGDFANEHTYELQTGEKLGFKKGAPNSKDLAVAFDEVETERREAKEGKAKNSPRDQAVDAVRDHGDAPADVADPGKLDTMLDDIDLPL